MSSDSVITNWETGTRIFKPRETQEVEDLMIIPPMRNMKQN